MRGLLIDPLSINFGLVGIAVMIGWLIQQALVLIESVTWGTSRLWGEGYSPPLPRP